VVEGISMGGMIAQELAIRHPELVDKLVLVSTTVGHISMIEAPERFNREVIEFLG
jgi:pimeloyl-ACP methyl ester carboxylesterase